jgi:hypothetical protein
MFFLQMICLLHTLSAFFLICIVLRASDMFFLQMICLLHTYMHLSYLHCIAQHALLVRITCALSCVIWIVIVALASSSCHLQCFSLHVHPFSSRTTCLVSHLRTIATHLRVSTFHLQHLLHLLHASISLARLLCHNEPIWHHFHSSATKRWLLLCFHCKWEVFSHLHVHLYPLAVETSFFITWSVIFVTCSGITLTCRAFRSKSHSLLIFTTHLIHCQIIWLKVRLVDKQLCSLYMFFRTLDKKIRSVKMFGTLGWIDISSDTYTSLNSQGRCLDVSSLKWHVLWVEW